MGNVKTTSGGHDPLFGVSKIADTLLLGDAGVLLVIPRGGQINDSTYELLHST